jgi:DNA-binding MarR family transcriptional regulator
VNKNKILNNNSEIWNLIGSIHHSISLIRQQELKQQLKQHHIPIRQLYVLRAIRDLGPDVTLSDVAKRVERQPHVISRQTILMEKDGLRRRRKTPKSNLLNLQITKKGLNIMEAAAESESIDVIFSSLSEKDKLLVKSALTNILIKVREFASSNIRAEVDLWLK